MIDPSLPLKNARHEAFCQARARGATLAKAWQAGVKPGGRLPDENSAKVSGHRVEKQAEVRLRIAHVRKALEGNYQADIPEVFDKTTIVELNLQISEVLENAYETAVTIGKVSPQKLERLRSVLSAHVGRQSKLSEEDAPVVKDTAAINAIAARAANLGFCKC
ncbi:MAG: hypothetical protein ABJP79_00720 [Tateyamaria sp.]|uniref:hypothetical protein n=1 Tax=Tateyamaria sp. TaxID=1929288 RepID=UPI00329EB0A0